MRRVENQGMSDRSRRSRAESAADRIAQAALRAGAGVRLGTREDLRLLCGVSVGTLHEALRMLQATGEVSVRSGPGGGVFAGEHTALASMLRDVTRAASTTPDFAETLRVLNALVPLLIDAAIAALDPGGVDTLTATLSSLETAARADLRMFVRSSLEMFAVVVALAPPGLLHTMLGSLLRTEIPTLSTLTDTIDPVWRDAVNRHLASVQTMVAALLANDGDAALVAFRSSDFIAIFVAIAARESRRGHT